MIVNELLNALRQLKQQKPVYDFTQFKLTVDGLDITKIEVNDKAFNINITTTGAVERATSDKSLLEEACESIE